MQVATTKRSHVLSTGTLARFATGLSWRAILDITAGHQKAWWRCAVADSEDRGLLEWDRAERVWRLTPLGRCVVRDVA